MYRWNCEGIRRHGTLLENLIYKWILFAVTKNYQSGNEMIWPLPRSPLASIPHWMPHWVSNSIGCKSKQLSLVSFNFHYRMKTSLELGVWFKTELSLFICQAGEKWDQKLLLSPKCPWSWPLFRRRSWKEQRCWCGFIWGCVLLRGRPSITAHSLGFRCSGNYRMSRMDTQLCSSPGETNGTPLVDGMDWPLEEICFMESFGLLSSLMLQINEVLQQRSQNLLLSYSRSRAICCQKKVQLHDNGITGLWLGWEHPLLFD